MWTTFQDIETFISDFEACRLPKARWTHHAHFLVGLWYLSRHSPEEALAIVRRRIRAYNESVGTANTESSGYHETLTRFYLSGIATHLAQHGQEPLPVSLARLLESPLVCKEHPLAFYSRERLFSAAARTQWLAPDLVPVIWLPTPSPNNALQRTETDGRLGSVVMSSCASLCR